METKSPWIREARSETFQEEAVERSREVPVVIDFWAPWCQPCRLLCPILHKLAEEFQGQFVLVQVNTEEMPEIAAAFGVQSIPAVFALHNGKLVDQFVGLLPEQQIRLWVERLLPSEAERLATAARELETADAKAAEGKYREAIRLSPNLTAAQVGLARVLLAQNQTTESRRILDELAAAHVLDAEGQRLHAEVVLREQANAGSELDALRAAAETEPASLQLRLQLAQALAAAGRYEEALQTGLEIIRSDRRTLGEPTRELMVRVFHLLGPESELAADYRRKLALALY